MPPVFSEIEAGWASGFCCETATVATNRSNSRNLRMDRFSGVMVTGGSVNTAIEYNTPGGKMQRDAPSGGVSNWPNVSLPRHADMLLVSIFQLFCEDPDQKHGGM